MRKMFIENEHMHYRLYKEDIFKLVKEDPDFEEYTIDEIKQKFNNGTLENIFLEITEDE